MSSHLKISGVALALVLAPGLLCGQVVGRRPATSAPAAQPAAQFLVQPTTRPTTQPATQSIAPQAMRAVPPAMAAVQSPLRYRAEPAPPVAPQVSCNGGLVTVRAENSTLASVLHEVARCAGSIVHMPASIGSTRVAFRYGPIQPMDLFAALLDGSADYVILGSNRGSSNVQMVIVKPHQAMSAAGQPVVQAAAMSTTVPGSFIDEEGVERLPSGLTQEEANMSPEELAQKFEAARQEQKRLEQLTQPGNPQQP